MKRRGIALVGVVLGLALLSGLSGAPAAAVGSGSSTTLTLTAGTDTSSARPFTFQPGVAYDITVAGALTKNFTDSSPPLTCVEDAFFQECHQTGSGPGSQRPFTTLQVFDDPSNYNTNSALPGAPVNTVQYNAKNTYSWVVPANNYGTSAVTKYFWADPYGSQEPYTTTWSGQITITLTPHVQQNRFGVRFSAVGLPNKPPSKLRDVVMAGSGRIQLQDSAKPDQGNEGEGTANVTLVEHWEVGKDKKGHPISARRKIQLKQSGDRASIFTSKAGGGELAHFPALTVWDSNDPNCEANRSKATLAVQDTPTQPDKVQLVLQCESAHTQHKFYFTFLNSAQTHVTTAIVGPQ